MELLFTDSSGIDYGAEDIYDTLYNIGANDCETLFIHSDVMFGKIPAGFKREAYLSALYEILSSLCVKNIIVPAFTYSFCNGEDYDVRSSRTSMGALNEYIRKKEGRYRTLDPLLSFSVPENLSDKFKNISEHSLGTNSGFDILHGMDGVKFLFLGARLGDCFTYVHYVEKIKDVCYRFDMPFEGDITDESGHTFHKRQYIHTACYGVKSADYYYFEDELEQKLILRKKTLGDKFVACISEKDAYTAIGSKLETNINYFLKQPFTQNDLVHKYTKGLEGRRITHC